MGPSSIDQDRAADGVDLTTRVDDEDAAGDARRSGRTGERRSDLEALRLFGIGAVFLVHCAQVFSPWQTWHIQNADTIELLGLFTVVAWPWVMPLFMLLAGAALHHSLDRRAPRAVLAERSRRLLIPLALGVLLVVPPQVYVERLQQGRFSGSYLDFYPTFFSSGIYPEGNFEAAHLWFLAYLFLYAVILVVPLTRLMRRDGLLAGVERASTQPLLLIGAPALLFAVGQVALRAGFPGSYLFVDDWANHALMAPAFLAGFVLAARPRIEAAVVDAAAAALAVGALALVVAGLVVWSADGNDVLPRAWGARYFVFWVSFGVASWCCLIALAGFARRHVRPSGRIRRLARGVPLFYVLHQTVIAVIAYGIVQLHAPAYAKLLLLVGAAGVTTLALTALVRARGAALSAVRRSARRP